MRAFPWGRAVQSQRDPAGAAPWVPHALLSTLAECYLQGVSTRKVRQIVEQRRGETVNSSTVSRATKQLDGQLAAWRARKLEREHEEIRRRTRVVRSFPSEASDLRLATALAADRRDQWAKRRCIMPASPTINVKRALKTPCAS